MMPLAVVPPGPLDRAILDVPGGFVWWYADLVTDAGTAVLIASWGLPFLPGLLNAARRDRPVVPRERPAIVLAVYGDAGFYVMDVPDAAEWTSRQDGDRLRFGDSTIELRWDAGKLTFEAALDLVAAGHPVRGTIRVEGRSGLHDPSALPDHGWSLLTAATDGELDLRFDGRSLQMRGPAYVDRNAGLRPLDQLMDPWTWARVSFPTGDLVLWDFQGGALGVWVHRDGSRREFTPFLHREGWQPAGGVGAPRRIGVQPLGATLELGRPLESAPFYARFPVTATLGGASGRGVAERCRPDRIDQGWMRPLVRMCVQERGRRSMWLPLFSGPREGRVGRLLRSWVAR